MWSENGTGRDTERSGFHFPLHFISRLLPAPSTFASSVSWSVCKPLVSFTVVHSLLSTFACRSLPFSPRPVSPPEAGPFGLPHGPYGENEMRVNGVRSERGEVNDKQRQ